MKTLSKLIVLSFCLLYLIMLPSKSFSADYYWVGGSGNWSDLQHWATSSGGTVNPPVVPSPFDNVFFDVNSFTASGQIVTIDQTIVSCHTMNWTGALYNPTLTGPNVNSLKIYGSLTFIPGMSYTFQGPVYFEASGAGKTISLAGKQFTSNVYFQGSAGGWDFLDDFSTTNTIYLYNGSLNTNGNNVNCSSFNSSPSNPAVRSLTLSSSIITLSSGSSSAFSIYNDNFTLSPGTSTIRFTGNGGGLYVSTYYGTYANLNFYNVEFTNTAGTSRIYSNDNYGSLIISSAVFHAHGLIQGSNTFANLTLAKGRTYEFESQRNQTITNSLNAIGTCNQPINMRAVTSGSQSTLTKTSGSITVDFIALRDMNATGGAVFTANNSVDVSNNSGWIINATTPLDLFWVGGTGNWDDSLHWSTTSGGPGGACVPTVNDNVFFDANSFSASGQTVTVNINAFCHDMTWTGALYNPTFSGNNTYSLNIYGSLTFISAMNMNVQGRVNFEATTLGKTITSATKQFVSNVYFQGAGGGWTFLDAFTTTNTLYLYNGSLNTNSQTVNAQTFNTSPSNPATRSLTLGASVMTLSSGSSSAWSSYNDNFTLNAGTSLLRFTGNGGGLYNSTYYGSYSNLAFYDAEFTHSTGVSRIYTNHNYGNLSFHDVIFYGNGMFQGNSTFNALTFTPAKSYEFESGRTQTIISAFNCIGTCNQPIYLRSITSGAQSVISKTSGSVVLEFVTLRDMHAGGGATFTANNSVNISNNSGWIINSSMPLDLYWVGGTGSWDNSAHWSTSSGGPGGACVPGVHDNVFFDVNSFTANAQTVTINASAYCNNMSWAGALYNPTLGGTSVYTLNLYGSLTLINAMNWTFQGRINFEAVATGKTITSAGKMFVSNVYFQGAGGGYTFNDDFSSNNTLYLINGHLNTNNQSVTCQSFNSSPSNPANRSLSLGSSVITLTSGSSSALSIYNDNFTINAGTSLIRFTGNGGGLYVSTYYGTYSNLTFNDVEFTNTAGTSRIYSNSNYGNLVFNKALFNGNGMLQGNTTFDSLTFSPGRTYQLESGKTQTIISEFISTGLGGFPIDLRSTTSGNQGTLHKAWGCVVLDFLQLRDNNATGGATWYAGVNSADVANNTGWNFSAPASMSAPGIISGPSVICPSTPNLNYSINPVSGAAGYIWAVIPPQAGSFVVNGPNAVLSPDPLYTGSFTIAVQAYDNCDTSAQALLPVTLDVSVDPPLFHGGNSNVCHGVFTSNYFATSSNATAFIWTLSPPAAGTISGTGQTATVSWDTSYMGNVTVSVQSYNNCDTSAPANFPVVVNPDPAKPTISLVGADLVSSPEDSYQWYLNGSFIPGATLQTYTPTVSGDYFVIVYNQYGCPAVSDTITIVISGVLDEQMGLQGNINVFPNPAADVVYVKVILENASELSIDVFDITGRHIKSLAEVKSLTPGVYDFTWQAADNKAGLYILKAVINDNVLFKKIVKDR